MACLRETARACASGPPPFCKTSTWPRCSRPSCRASGACSNGGGWESATRVRAPRMAERRTCRYWPASRRRPCKAPLRWVPGRAGPSGDAARRLSRTRPPRGRAGPRRRSSASRTALSVRLATTDGAGPAPPHPGGAGPLAAQAPVVGWHDAPRVRSRRTPGAPRRLIPRPRINLILYHGVLPFDFAQGTPSMVEGWGRERRGGRSSSASGTPPTRARPTPPTRHRPRRPRASPSPAHRPRRLNAVGDRLARRRHAGLTSCVAVSASIPWRVRGAVGVSD